MSMDPYFLPAKSKWDDGGTPDEFYQKRVEQIRGVKLMLDERRHVSGLSKKRIITFFASGGSIFGSTPFFNSPDSTLIQGGNVFTAVENSGYEFVSWSSDIDISTWISGNSITVTDAIEEATIYAVFKKIGDPDPTFPTKSINPILSSRLISDFHLAVEDTIGFFLDDTVYPSGDLTGNAGTEFNYWNLANILNQIGIGVSGKWTVTPARNPYSFPSSGGDIATDFHGKLSYKEHINEMAQVLNRCLYLPIYGQQVETEDRVGNGRSPSSYADANANAISNWNASSWNPASQCIGREGVNFFISGSSEPYGSQITNIRGKIKFDLSNCLAGAAQIFLFLVSIRQLITDPDGPFGNSPPTSGAERTWSKWNVETPTLGSNWTSNLISPSQFIPSTNGESWFIARIITRIPSASDFAHSQVVVLTPSFTYTL
jgi:hypothetical protein